ncbi:MAG: hypothetical protein ACFCD0_05105 [Gemmataceae bacterium]
MSDSSGNEHQETPTKTRPNENELILQAPVVLKSGRVLALKVADTSEDLEIRSPDGELELRITLTADGPVVHLKAAKLQLEATDEVAVRCKKFSVHTTEATSLETEGDMHLSAKGEMTSHSDDDTKITGKMIYLN